MIIFFTFSFPFKTQSSNQPYHIKPKEVHADFVQAALGRNGVFHVSHDSSAIDAREKGQRKPQTEEEKAETALGALVMSK